MRSWHFQEEKAILAARLRSGATESTQDEPFSLNPGNGGSSHQADSLSASSHVHGTGLLKSPKVISIFPKLFRILLLLVLQFFIPQHLLIPVSDTCLCGLLQPFYLDYVQS